jgi:hypothetical protein
MTSARVPTVKRADGITRPPSGDATARSDSAPSADRAPDSEPDDPRRDCPWKCWLGDPKSICMRDSRASAASCPTLSHAPLSSLGRDSAAGVP